MIKAVNHPQVTKIVRIILERCDDEERARSQDKNGTDYTIYQVIVKTIIKPVNERAISSSFPQTDVMNSKKTLTRESEDSEESSEGD